MALCSTADVTAYLNITSTGENTLIGTFVDAAQAMIERYTGRKFDVTQDSTRYFNPIIDVRGKALHFDGELAQAPTTVVNGDGVTVTAQQYATEPKNQAPYYGLRLLQSGGVAWTWATDPEGAIAVTGRWGYSTAAPADVKHACIRLAAWLYRQRENAPEADRTITTITGDTLRPMRMPADVESILAPYVRRA